MSYRRRLPVQVALCLAIAYCSNFAQNGIGASIVNGSFENGTDPGTSANLTAPDSTTIQGWSVISGTIDYIGSRWTAGDGTRCLDLSGVSAGAIQQTVTGFVPGEQYELSFLMAGNPESGPAIKQLDASVGATSQSYSFDNTGFTKTHLGWTEKTLDFVATSSSMDVTFTSQTAGNAGPALDLVNITLVPEPAAWMLLIGASPFLLLLRAKNRQARKTIKRILKISAD